MVDERTKIRWTLLVAAYTRASPEKRVSMAPDLQQQFEEMESWTDSRAAGFGPAYASYSDLWRWFKQARDDASRSTGRAPELEGTGSVAGDTLAELPGSIVDTAKEIVDTAKEKLQPIADKLRDVLPDVAKGFATVQAIGGLLVLLAVFYVGPRLLKARGA